MTQPPGTHRLAQQYLSTGRVEIGAKVLNAIILILVSVGITLAGLAAIGADQWFIGVLLALFGLVGLGFSVLRLFAGGKVVVDRTGVTSRGHTARWDEIVAVGLIEVAGQTFTMLQLTPEGQRRLVAEGGAFHRVNAATNANTMALNNQLRVSMHELADLVEFARRHAAGELPATPGGTPQPGRG